MSHNWKIKKIPFVRTDIITFSCINCGILGYSLRENNRIFGENNRIFIFSVRNGLSVFTYKLHENDITCEEFIIKNIIE